MTDDWLILINQTGQENKKIGGGGWGMGDGVVLNQRHLTLSLPRSNSPYYLPYNSRDVSSENMILDQLIIP